MLPWALAWVLARHHHLDTTAVTSLVTVSIPLATLWLAWAAFRNASRPSEDSGAGPGIMPSEPGSVVADRWGTAIGQVVYRQRREVTGKPVRLGDPPPLLAGRADLLAELDTRLTGGDSPTPRKAALYGLGGAGKTSVALAYAHRHLAEVGVAWQFPAEDATVLAAGFGELAAQLGARDLADTRDPVASVHAVLATFPAPWLLIFDNAADMASVAAFLPPAGPGQVLITSQNPTWPGQPLNVPMLDREVAAGFLVDRTSDPNLQAARDLATSLDGLPLALEQAAAYIQTTQGTLASYLALFRHRRGELLSRGEPTGYDKTVASTWALALDRLQQTAPDAVGLLRLLAFCAPEAIPLRLLLLQPHPRAVPEAIPLRLLLQQGSRFVVRSWRRVWRMLAPLFVLAPLLTDPLAADEAIAALRRYSLVTPAADGSVSVHRLVQAVTADRMTRRRREAWRAAAAALIEAAIPADASLPESWSACAALLPHARAALTYDSYGMDKLAGYLGYQGSYVAALDLWQRILGARERSLGPEHPSTLIARANVAYVTGQAGDAAGARDQFAALLPIEERVRGAEHPDTLADRGNLARWTGDAGDAAGARDQFAALLPIFKRVRGAEHPDTLTTRANLAGWTGEAGYAAGARDQYDALVHVIERVLGSEHPGTLTTRGNLADWTGEAGDAAGARDQYAALLPIEERVRGAEHPDTLTTRGGLARWTGEAGDAAGARDQYDALVHVIERVLGTEHPDTLADRGNLARWTGDAGDAAGARDQFAALLPIFKRVRGAEHPDTLTTRGGLARWTGEAGDAAGARDQYAALLPIEERVRGAEHPRTLSTRRNLAHWTERVERGPGTRGRCAVAARGP